MAYIVSAGYVTVETAVPGGRARIDIPQGAVLPEDVPQEDVDRLLARSDIQPLVPVEPKPIRKTAAKK